MLILPFTHNVVKQNEMYVNVFNFLTVGGHNLWEESNSLEIDKDILNPNDIYRKGALIKFDKKLQLCEVDIQKTKLSDFYKWEEIELQDQETFCWRTYIYMTGTNNQIWLEIPTTEQLSNYSVQKLIKTIIQKK